MELYLITHVFLDYLPRTITDSPVLFCPEKHANSSSQDYAWKRWPKLELKLYDDL